MSAQPTQKTEDIALLSRYLDDDLTPDERSSLERRLEADPELLREFERLRSALQKLQNLPTLDPPEDFVHQVRRRIKANRRRSSSEETSSFFPTLLALLVLLVILIALSVFSHLILSPIKPTPPPSPRSSNSSTLPAKRLPSHPTSPKTLPPSLSPSPPSSLPSRSSLPSPTSRSASIAPPKESPLSPK